MLLYTFHQKSSEMILLSLNNSFIVIVEKIISSLHFITIHDKKIKLCEYMCDTV